VSTLRDVDSSVAFVDSEIEKLVAALRELSTPRYADQLVDIAAVVVASLRNKGRIFFCGNGGSAADAQHLAAELVGRQNFDRPAAAGIALTVDTSALTAVANDYGYEAVFSRQLEALGQPGDVLFGLSTSGRSANVVKAIETAKRKAITTVSFTGLDARDMGVSDFVVAVPATETAKIQELHITCGHIVFALAERILFRG
jgi:D-sedoheptulose 7-phosphate isomerase